MKDIALVDHIRRSSKKEKVIQDKSHHTSSKRKHMLDRDMQDPQESLMESSSEGSQI